MTHSKILEILLNVAKRNGDHFDYCEGYAEPGYETPDCKIIAFGDWNSRRRRVPLYNKPIPSWLIVKDPDAMIEIEDNTMARIGAILEKMGAAVEWSDEWATCSDCCKAVRTEPDSYGWTRSFWEDNGEIQCEACMMEDPELYLEYLEGNPRKANTMGVDLDQFEYIKLRGEYENGLHEGQADSPEVIAESLRKLGVERFIFEIDDVGQFDVHFCVWVHKSEACKLIGKDLDSIPGDPSPAERCKRLLREASLQMRKQAELN